MRVTYRLRALMGEWEIRNPGQRLTQARLAEQTGLRPSTITNICNGKITRIEHSTIIALCGFFHCQISDLMTLTEDNPSPDQ